ncbi:MAG TPA: crotonase/enoyl-CoA hydratase family protein, partial [Labilithrix sp.]|nr:crotonase/enoyl-CoA hydratase family protein [Labilithrix sp.]
MAADDNSRVLIEREGAYAHVILNRPSKHNAFDWGMFDALLSAANELAAERELRAVFLRGEGPSFSSGLDVPSFGKTPLRALQVFFQPGSRTANLAQEVCLRWRRIGAPVFAVVSGNCFGAGLQLALAADFRFAHPSAKLSVMEAKWGLIPDMGGSVLLRELVGIDIAKMLTMTARVLDAETARGYGLVTAVDAEPLAAARQLADEIATRSPDAVAAAKALFQETWTAAESDALSVERRLQARMFASKNRKIAVENLAAKGERQPKAYG